VTIDPDRGLGDASRRSRLLAEDAVHGLGALCDDRSELLAIDRLRDRCVAMAEEAGDLLDGDTRC
jgi:hypothetical protein